MRLMDQFLSSIPGSRMRTASSMLGDENRQGAFQDRQEFEERLREFRARVVENGPAILFEPRLPRPFNRVRSDHWNDMLTRANGDLEALFAEFGLMDDMIQAHREIFEGQALHELREVLLLLEARVAELEFLSSNPDGFSSTQWNTFFDGSRSCPKDSPLSNMLRTDLRTGGVIPSDLSHDPILGALTLPMSDEGRILFTDVKVLDGVVDPWSGQVSRSVSEEAVMASRYAGHVWVFRTLNRPLVDDPEMPIVFSWDSEEDPASDTSAVGWFQTQVENALPAGPGEYLVVHDADDVTALSVLIPGVREGEVFFWNEPGEVNACLDAVLSPVQVGMARVQASIDAILQVDQEVVVALDALLVREGEASIDAIVLDCRSPHQFGTVSYGYLVDSPLADKGDLFADPSTADVRNILRPADGTYWFDLILKDSQVPGGALSRLLLGLGGPREIDHVDIFPATRHPFVIEEVSCLTTSGTRISVHRGESRISGTTRIDFDKALATAVILDIRQPNFEVHAYDLSTGREVRDLLAGDPAALPDEIREGISNGRMLELLGMDSAPREGVRTVHEYIYGLDSVSTGLRTFGERGVFAGQATRRTRVGAVALETRTSSVPGARVSFEHVVTKRDFDARGAEIRSARFPILDLNQTEVSHERLLLGTDMAGRTRFRAHGMVGDGADAAARQAFCSLRVFRNRQEIFSPASWTITNNVGVANDDDRFTEVRILGDPGLAANTNAIYTVSYQPLQVLVAEERDYFADPSAELLRMRANGIVETSFAEEGGRTAGSELHLTTVMRLDDMDDRSSVARFDEYRLLIGEILPNRFAAVG